MYKTKIISIKLYLKKNACTLIYKTDIFSEVAFMFCFCSHCIWQIKINCYWNWICPVVIKPWNRPLIKWCLYCFPACYCYTKFEEGCFRLKQEKRVKKIKRHQRQNFTNRTVCGAGKMLVIKICFLFGLKIRNLYFLIYLL